MQYENVVAISITLMAIIVTILGLDDGSLIKTVIGAYLGFLAGKRLKNGK